MGLITTARSSSHPRTTTVTDNTTTPPPLSLTTVTNAALPQVLTRGQHYCHDSLPSSHLLPSLPLITRHCPKFSRGDSTTAMTPSPLPPSLPLITRHCDNSDNRHTHNNYFCNLLFRSNTRRRRRHIAVEFVADHKVEYCCCSYSRITT